MAKKTKNAANSIDPNITLAQLSIRYLEWMEQQEKSLGTCFSYSQELRTAQLELGADTIVSTITAHDIERFNNSARVTKLKSGKSKAQPSIDKTRRVIRLALAFGEQSGLIAQSPIPAKVVKDDAPAPEPEPTPAPKKTRKSRALVDIPAEQQQVEPAPAA